MRDSSSFANFCKAFTAEWFTLMSGGISVPLVIAAVYFTNPPLKIGLGLTAIVCFVSASFHIWKVEREARIRAEAARGHLSISYPQCFRDSYGNDRWRVSIQNDGSIVVANVQIKLMDVTPPPRSPLWHRDLPRLVGRAGMTLDTPPDRINVHDASDYELIIASSGSTCVIGFDNQSQQIQIENDEQLCLSYRLTSENTDPISVTFRLYIKEYKVIMERRL